MGALKNQLHKAALVVLSAVITLSLVVVGPDLYAQVSKIPAPAVGAGTGDALVANPLSQFAGTTSAQLAGVLSNETGSGLAVFGTAPTLASTVTIGTASGTTGKANLVGTTSGTVGVTVAAAAGTWTLTLPTTAGTDTYVLTTNGSGVTTWAAPSGGGILSGLTTLRMVLANGTTGVNTPIDVNYDAADTGGSVGGKPLLEFNLATRVETIRTSTADNYPGSEFVRHIAPSADTTTGSGAVIQTRSYVEAAHKWTYSFGVDALVTMEPGAVDADPMAPFGSAIGGISTWADNKSSSWVQTVLGMSVVARMTGAAPEADTVLGINISPADPSFGASVQTGTTTDYGAIYIHDYTLAAPHTMTTVNRYGLKLGAMAGSVTGGYDYAIYSLATQASYFTGAVFSNTSFNLGSGAFIGWGANVVTLTHNGSAALTLEGSSGASLIVSTANGGGGIISQVLIGGSATTSTLKLYPTVNASATTGADILFAGGANGVSEWGRFLHGGTFQLGVSGTLSGIMKFQGSTSGAVTIQASASAITNYTLTLPTAQASGTQYLVNNGSGVLSWATLSGGGDAVIANGIQQFTGNTSLSMSGKITTYNNIATSGSGVVPIRLENISTTKVADHPAATLTAGLGLPATAGRYRITAVVTTTSSTNTGSFQMKLAYKDSQGTAHTADIIPVIDATGAIATTGATTVAASKEYHMIPYEFTIDNSQTDIILTVDITGTMSYTDSAVIEQIAP